jgi:rhodanese-related sulfurtransferase
MLKKFLATLALILPITLGATACATEPVELSADTVIIDVRTPEEFAGGHLEGALNIDVQSGDFAAEISQLDPAGDYFVYCRSGNRSGQAISQMSNMGFSSMTNGGSVANASSISGVPVVID